MDIPYSSKSRFFELIDAAIPTGADLMEPVTVPLGPGGYERVAKVEIGDDPDVFGTDWESTQPSRFSARLRAAATVLRMRGYRGRFLLRHRDGDLFLQREESFRVWDRAARPRRIAAVPSRPAPSSPTPLLPRATTRIALVSCVKTKLRVAAAAKDLYASPLFKQLRTYAEARADRWYILSAEYGLVGPDRIIEPYEKTLLTMPSAERAAWAARVQDELSRVVPSGAEIILLAGARYREHLLHFLESRGCRVEIPLEGLKMGEQLQRLGELNRTTAASNTDLDRFYELLARLERLPGQGRRLSEYSGRYAWPTRGVYFFREPGEHRTGSDTPRIVRVGTHAVSVGARSTLWQRLRAHRGRLTGGGNHRASIFRLHVGAALLNRDRSSIGELPTWGRDQSAGVETRRAEAEHERRVSEYIGGMTLVWLPVPDEPGLKSLRSYIERNAIGLLSNHLSPPDPASPSWLGRYSERELIRRSGLWNLDYVESTYEGSFLQVMGDLVEKCLVQ